MDMLRPFFIIQAMLIVSLLQTQEMTVETLLQKHFDAVGGQESWQKLNTIYAEQSYWAIPIDLPAHQRFLGNHMPKNQKSFYQYPDQYRIAIFREGEPTTATIVNRDETKFYIYRTKQEAILPNPVYTKAVQEAAFSFLLLGPSPAILTAYEDSVLVYQGKMEAFDKLCYKLVITDGLPSGGQASVYLSAETFRVHAVVHSDHEELHKIYEDYRKVDGLLIPHQIGYYQKGVLFGKFTIDKIEVNQSIDSSVFTVW